VSKQGRARTRVVVSEELSAVRRGGDRKERDNTRKTGGAHDCNGGQHNTLRPMWPAKALRGDAGGVLSPWGDPSPGEPRCAGGAAVEFCRVSGIDIQIYRMREVGVVLRGWVVGRTRKTVIAEGIIKISMRITRALSSLMLRMGNNANVILLALFCCQPSLMLFFQRCLLLPHMHGCRYAPVCTGEHALT